MKILNSQKNGLVKVQQLRTQMSLSITVQHWRTLSLPGSGSIFKIRPFEVVTGNLAFLAIAIYLPTHLCHKIIFPSKERVGIITQNENGPCPLLSIVNVLLLRGKLSLPDGCEVSSSNTK